MFKGANTVGALPLTDEHPSWLPVDYAGRAITEIVLRSDETIPKSTVYHIVNPNTSASWADILVGLKDAGVKFETVDRMEWLERLATSEKDPERNPIIKLLVCISLFLYISDFLVRNCDADSPCSPSSRLGIRMLARTLNR